MTAPNEKRKSEPMEEQQVAARDTTFDGVIPKRIWISHRTTDDRKYIVCFVEINGIEKEIGRYYVHDYDGIISESTNLTWILSAYQALQKKLAIAVECIGMIDAVGMPEPYASQVRQTLRKIEALDE